MRKGTQNRKERELSDFDWGIFPKIENAEFDSNETGHSNEPNQGF